MKTNRHFSFFFSPHCSCFAPSCHSSHQKNRFGCCWARVFFQLSRKLICNTESCPDSGGFFSPNSRLVLSFLQCTLNWAYCPASNTNWIHYSLSCLQYILTVFVCVFLQAWYPCSNSSSSNSRASPWFLSCSRTCRAWWEWTLGDRCPREPCLCRWACVSVLMLNFYSSSSFCVCLLVCFLRWNCPSNSFFRDDKHLHF